MKTVLLLFILFCSLACVQAQTTLSCSKASHYKKLHAARTEALYPDNSPLLHQYDVHYYKLDVSADTSSNAIEGIVTIAATVIDGPLNHFAFHLNDHMSITNVLINGVSSSFTRNNGLVDVTLSSPVALGMQLNAEITYAGDPEAGMFNGREPYGNESVTWTLSEPYSAFHWFPVKQVLSDKADSVEVWITTDQGCKAGSNGLLKNVTAFGAKNRYEWKSNYPTDYYLISLAIGHYVDYTIYAHPTGAPQAIPVVNYIYAHPTALTAFQAEIDKTTGMIEDFSEKLGLYPFHLEKYGHCTAPIGGGMEHQTMTTQSDFIDFLTAHELGHQWFGDLVTCDSWEDIWLNEGFASYTEYLYKQDVSETAAYDWMYTTQSIASALPTGSVFVDDTTDVARIFDPRLTYKKGAAVLHMLRNEIHDDNLFFQSLRDYLQTYKYKTARTEDFQQSVENTTGLNLTTFFNQWYKGSGYPVYTVTWNQGAQGNFYLRNEQTGSDATVTPFFNNTIEYFLKRSGAPDTVVRVALNQATNEFIFPHVQGTILDIVVDSSQWVLHKVNSITQDPGLVTGIGQQQFSAASSLFPNPAAETLTLSTPSYHGDVKLYNASGQWIKTLSLAGEVHAIDLKGLPTGLYLILLQEGKVTLRFAKE